MKSLKSYTWVFGVIGGALTLGFLARLYLLGGVDGRGQLFAVAAALCLVAYAWLDREVVESVARDRSVQLGGGAVLLVALAGGLCVAAYAVVRTTDVYVDLTRDQRVSLTEHSRAVARSVEQDVTLYGFFRHGTGDQASFTRLAEQFVAQNPRIRFELVDPLRQPSLARSYDVTSDASVVVASGDRGEHLGRRYGESAVTNAIRRVTSDVDVEICWSFGHGEADVDTDGEDGAAASVVLALEGQSYAVREVSTVGGPVPASCAAFVIMGPQTPWAAEEVSALQRYLVAGGRVMALLEPGAGGSRSVADGLRPFGVDIDNDPVIDPHPSRRYMAMDDPSVLVMRREAWRAHPLSESLAGAVLMHIASAVRGIDDMPGVAVRSLLWTSDRAWTERDGPGEVSPGEHEPVGEIPLVTVVEIDDAASVVVEAEERRDDGRLFVVGDTAFATNLFATFGSNQDLFLNAIAWLVDEEELLGERPQASDEVLELSMAEELLLALLAIFVMPGLAAFLALRSHMRRRSL